jgi:hypothetical protein
MLNSVVVKTAPLVAQSNMTFLRKVVSASLPVSARPFSVAFNIKSRFEEAFEK